MLSVSVGIKFPRNKVVIPTNKLTKKTSGPFSKRIADNTEPSLNNRKV